LTPAERRFLEAAERIRTERPTLDDLAYMARELVQVTLPHRNPGDVPAWSRANGNLTMTIRPGWDAQTEKPIGYPFGNLPRLLLFWLTAEAVRTRCRTIELGNSLSDFMFQLGLNPAGRGRRSDASRLREQMERLFRATISFDRTVTEDARTGTVWMDMQITSGGEMWWSPRDPSQATLWGSWIELGEKFFRAIIAHPVPLDMRALKALKRSPLALDLYSWLTYEAYRAHKSGKGRFVAWSLLAQQMGDDYARTTDFQQKAVAILRKVRALYPTLKLGPLRGGIRIEPDSLPAITARDLGWRRPPPARIADASTAPEAPLATPDQFAGLRRELSGQPPVKPRPPLEDAASVRRRAAERSLPRPRPAAVSPAMRKYAKEYVVRFLRAMIELDEDVDRLAITYSDGRPMMLMNGGVRPHTPETKAVLQQIVDDLLRVPDGSLGVEPECPLTPEVEAALQQVRDDLLRAELDDD
jgi:hypothetical protein